MQCRKCGNVLGEFDFICSECGAPFNYEPKEKPKPKKRPWVVVAAAALVLAVVLLLLGSGGDDVVTETGVQSPVTEAVSPVPAGAAVRQVTMSSFSTAVSVLYEDGTVRVSPGEVLKDTDLRETVEQWQNVDKIWNNCGSMVGLTRDGRVLYANGYAQLDTSFMDCIVDVAFMEPDLPIYGLDGNGRVLAAYDGYVNETVAGWTNVEKLIPYLYYGAWAVCRDGTVLVSMEGIPDDFSAGWTNVEDLVPFSTCVLVIHDDGTVEKKDWGWYDGVEIPNEDASLYGVKKALCNYDGVIFGITADGDLRVSGGEDWYNGIYAPRYGKAAVDFDRMTDLVDLVPFGTMQEWYVGLRRDGTVVSLDPQLGEELKGWTDVKKIVTYFDFSSNEWLYALHGDGSVTALRLEMDGGMTQYPNYRGWSLADIWGNGGSNGVIGQCRDGSFVADGYYEYELDLTTLEK